MHERNCNPVTWMLVLPAIAVLAIQGRTGFLGLKVPFSLIFAGLALWARKHNSELTCDREKR